MLNLYNVSQSAMICEPCINILIWKFVMAKLIFLQNLFDICDIDVSNTIVSKQFLSTFYLRRTLKVYSALVYKVKY